jgi:hypothetical protein
MDAKKEAKPKKKSWMDRNFGKLVAVLLVILMMSIALSFIFNQTTQDEYDLSPDNLSDEINDNQWTLYTMTNCPACIEQKKVLGNHSDDIIIITCDESQYYYNLCKNESIKVVPTWVNVKTGQHVEGYQTLEDIEVMLNG